MSNEDPLRDKENVISLEHRRSKRRTATPSPARQQPEEAASAPPPSAGDQAAGEHAAEKHSAVSRAPLPGQLVWLHCPTCATLEYSELVMPGGRRHKCGSIVEEAVVDLDVRAEWTLAEVNLARIDALGRYLEHQRERFREYQRRLELAAGRRPEPYGLDEESVKSLPVAELDSLGLFISKALHDPAARFTKKDKA